MFDPCVFHELTCLGLGVYVPIGCLMIGVLYGGQDCTLGIYSPDVACMSSLCQLGWLGMGL